MSRTAAALIIGNELLSGKVQDANTVVLARELRSLGIELRRVVVVPDEPDAITNEVTGLRASHDLLFTSGGVGPTHDDITMACVARALGRRVIRDERVVALIRAHYQDRLTDGHLHMADIVEGTDLAFGDDPISWPAFLVENVVVLPGIPELFRVKIAAVRERIRGSEAGYVLRSVYLRCDEGTLKPYLDVVVAAHPAVQVGSYPLFRGADYSVRVTFDGRDEAKVRAAAEALVAAIPAEYVVRTEA